MCIRYTLWCCRVPLDFFLHTVFLLFLILFFFFLLFLVLFFICFITFFSADWIVSIVLCLCSWILSSVYWHLLLNPSSEFFVLVVTLLGSRSFVIFYFVISFLLLIVSFWSHIVFLVSFSSFSMISHNSLSTFKTVDLKLHLSSYSPPALNTFSSASLFQDFWVCLYLASSDIPYHRWAEEVYAFKSLTDTAIQKST